MVEDRDGFVPLVMRPPVARSLVVTPASLPPIPYTSERIDALLAWNRADTAFEVADAFARRRAAREIESGEGEGDA